MLWVFVSGLVGLLGTFACLACDAKWGLFGLLGRHRSGRPTQSVFSWFLQFVSGQIKTTKTFLASAAKLLARKLYLRACDLEE
jgi:hypothetical protein